MLWTETNGCLLDPAPAWPLPLWFFAALYVVVWIYVLVLWWRVPPGLPWKSGRLMNFKRR
jgi:hypothetical protein